MFERSEHSRFFEHVGGMGGTSPHISLLSEIVSMINICAFKFNEIALKLDGSESCAVEQLKLRCRATEVAL